MKCRNLCCVQNVQLHPFAGCRALAITSFQSGVLLEALEVSYFIDLTIFRLITSRSLRDPPLPHSQRPASPLDKNWNSLSTVAILAQGTSWAVAVTQAFL